MILCRLKLSIICLSQKYILTSFIKLNLGARKVNYYIVSLWGDCKKRGGTDEMFEAVGGVVILIPLSVSTGNPPTCSLLKRFAPASHRGGLNGAVQTRTGAASITAVSPRAFVPRLG